MRSPASIASSLNLIIKPIERTDNNPEAYQLNITPGMIDLAAPTTAGLINGVQTLRQLIQKKDGRAFVPCCKITDWPAFRIRGFMHDVGRNFQDVELIKQHLDMMAFYLLLPINLRWLAISIGKPDEPVCIHF